MVTEGYLRRYAMYTRRDMNQWESLRGEFDGLSALAVDEKMEAARAAYNKASTATTTDRPPIGVKQPTEKQLAVLYKYGIANGEKMTRSGASKIIGMLFDKNDDVWSLVQLRDGRQPAF